VTASIYADWLPGPYTYLFHLLAWMGPIVLLQWAVGFRILLANAKAVVFPTLLVGTYLSLTDVVAVFFGVWYFDEDLILGIKPMGVPLEEWIFFYLTSLLCAQSFLLFLPDRYRHPSR